MDYTLYQKYIRSMKKPGVSILLAADHAMGKSAAQVDAAIAKRAFFIDMRLGQRDLGDVLGMPTVYMDTITNRQRFTHVTPDIIWPVFVKDLNDLGTMGDELDILAERRPASDIGKPYECIILFLDELNRATKDVQQSIFELVLDRRMSGKKAHPMCYIVSAINSNMDVYTVTEIDPALITRFSYIPFAPTRAEWMEWGRVSGEICPEILFTMEKYNELVDPPSKVKDMEFLKGPHPNRRSWHGFSKWFVQYRASFSESEMQAVCSSFVGEKASEIFKHQLKEFKKKRGTSEAVETKKVSDFINNYLKGESWNSNTARDNMKKMNPSELDLLAEETVAVLSELNLLSAIILGKIEMMAANCPQEIFSKIFNDLAGTAARPIIEKHFRDKKVDMTRFSTK